MPSSRHWWSDGRHPAAPVPEPHPIFITRRNCGALSKCRSRITKAKSCAITVNRRLCMLLHARMFVARRSLVMPTVQLQSSGYKRVGELFRRLFGAVSYQIAAQSHVKWKIVGIQTLRDY